MVVKNLIMVTIKNNTDELSTVAVFDLEMMAAIAAEIQTAS